MAPSLSERQDVWPDRVDAEISQAHGARSIDVLPTDQAAFNSLNDDDSGDGILHALKVTLES